MTSVRRGNDKTARFWRSALMVVAVSVAGCEELPNVPPSATFIFSPVSPIVSGQSAVVFNAAGSRDSDGTIASFVWNFGDGTPDQTGSGATIVHVFPDTPAICVNITYAVLLTVVDDSGEQASFSQNITVTELPAPGSLACQNR